MTAAVIPFAVPGGSCPRCLRPVSAHRIAGLWVGCVRDRVLGRDDEATASDRRARLARLQTRVLKVLPWAADLVEQIDPSEGRR